MTLHRAYCPSPKLRHAHVSDIIELPTDVSHRLVRVLRLGPKNLVELFDNNGTIVTGRLVSAATNEFKIEEIRHEVKKQRTLTLIQALVKLDKLEEIVQRNTEIGVDRFVFFTAARSVVKVTERTASQMERLVRIAADAARQCERNDIPVIVGPFSIAEITRDLEKPKLLTLLGDPRGGKPLLEVLRKTDLSEIEEVILIVGPEGGVSEDEEDAFISAGAISVYFSKYVLRTQTAGIVGASIIQSFL